MTKSTLHDPEFDVDSKSTIKTVLGARNLELQPETWISGRSCQTEVRPDATEATQYSNSWPKSIPGNPNLYPEHYSTARTRPNGKFIFLVNRECRNKIFWACQVHVAYSDQDEWSNLRTSSWKAKCTLSTYSSFTRHMCCLLWRTLCVVHALL